MLDNFECGCGRSWLSSLALLASTGALQAL
jgi:hypothetical protein